MTTGVTRVWQAPTVFEWTSGGDTIRWELATTTAGTHVVLTAWFDGDDPNVTAGAIAAYHVCFEQFIRLIDDGYIDTPASEERAGLAGRYAVALAKALADTD
jgi:hypothetical protein